MSDLKTSETAIGNRPAPWVFLVLIAATLLSAGIGLSMMSAPEMLSNHDGAAPVRFFLAVGAVYLGMPFTWILGLAVIATYPRTSANLINRSTTTAAAIWTVVLAIPYVLALLA